MKTRSSIAALAAIALTSVLGVPSASAKDEARTVQVMTRTWAVTQVQSEPVIYRATRDNNNLNPFGQPARLRTTQAIAAIQKATGCRVIYPSMYQNISGQFFSQVSCG